MTNIAVIDHSANLQASDSSSDISPQICKEVVRMRLGERGDGSRPLSWRKIAVKLKITIETVRKARRSPYYFNYVLDVCNNIGIARMQACAARQNKPLPDLLDKSFGIDPYLTDALIGVMDENSLDLCKGSDPIPDDEAIEYLAQQADRLVVVHDKESTTGFGLVQTIKLTRRHTKWLIAQGYEHRSDRILFRAAAMTRGVSARTPPKNFKEKDKKTPV